MFTVITKGNNVNQYVSFDSVERSVKGPFLAIDSGNGSKVAFTATSPITWPADATSGLQAIVDVKVGTLRFAYDGWPRSQTEFVVSEYVEPPSRRAATREEVMALVETWPTDWNKTGEKLTDDWIWAVLGGQPVIINQTENLASNTVISEDEWREYLVEVLRKNPPIIGTKHDHGKPILGAVPPHAELAVGRVLTFGAEKYARGNWDKVEDHENRYMDAALRHLNAHRRGELTDSESGESHLAHAACCILFMLDKQERS